jgi:hypothetical protein
LLSAYVIAPVPVGKVVTALMPSSMAAPFK